MPRPKAPVNYRHDHHAGNAADCLKHLTLSLALERLLHKDAPLFYLETHAGAGRYSLANAGEHSAGVDRVWAARRELKGLSPWLDLLEEGAEDGVLRHYPGSPVVAARLLRPGDRMVLAETVAVVREQLRHNLAGRARTSILGEDGYAILRGHLPPPERRGLILMDPPFERRDEWEALAKAIIGAHARWPQGCQIVWYPVKVRGMISRLLQSLQRALDMEVVELRLEPETGGTNMVGSGLILVRPPWGLRERLLAALAVLGPVLAQGGFWDLSYRALPQSAPVWAGAPSAPDHATAKE